MPLARRADWMLIRGEQRRPVAEMSGAMLLEAFLLVALAWAGVIGKG